MTTLNHHHNQTNSPPPPPPQVAVVMVPLPAHGHLNQLLHLSRLIAAYNIPVHYATTATHNREAKRRAHGWDPRAAANLHFHDLPLPPYHSPPPTTTTTNKFPSHLQPLFDAQHHLRHPLAALLHSLSHTSHRVVIIHDSLMSSVVQDVSSIHNAESYAFHSVSAFSIFWFFYEQMEKPFPLDHHHNILKEKLPSVLEDCFTSEFMQFIGDEQKYLNLSSGCLYNSCREVEGEFMDLIGRISECVDQKQKHWAIGPFNPVQMNRDQNECLEWLDKQEPKSVILVSFGTTTSLSDEQIGELANGLEESGMKFIWVLRDADTGNLNSNNREARKCDLPKGFEERVKEKAVVVRDWAPQLEILSHRATGAFVSHCGWNSCMESLSMGVPMATWPMHSDQPRNAVLTNEVLKVSLAVTDWDKRNEIVTSSTISEALTRLMGSEEGAEIRRRAEELGGAVRRAVAEGDVTRLEMDSFIAHISRWGALARDRHSETECNLSIDTLTI